MSVHKSWPPFLQHVQKSESPLQMKKTEGLQTVIIILGLELDSILMAVRIPEENKWKYTNSY